MSEKQTVRAIATPDIPWVSRNPSGGWVFWENEYHYLEAQTEIGGYRNGRPATECECYLISLLKQHEDVRQIGLSKFSPLGADIKTDPDLLKTLDKSVNQVKRMAEEQVEEMARQQGKSYARAEAGSSDL